MTTVNSLFPTISEIQAHIEELKQMESDPNVEGMISLWQTELRDSSIEKIESHIKMLNQIKATSEEEELEIASELDGWLTILEHKVEILNEPTEVNELMEYWYNRGVTTFNGLFDKVTVKLDWSHDTVNECVAVFLYGVKAQEEITPDTFDIIHAVPFGSTDYRLVGTVHAFSLEGAYKMIQNGLDNSVDLKTRSTSVGDIIGHNGKYYLVKGIGFEEVDSPFPMNEI